MLLAVLLPFSCSSDLSEDVEYGTIVGSVSDATTGEPVATVNVRLTPGGSSTVTGSDGSFTFRNLDPMEYTIEISKEGYKANTAKVFVKKGEPTASHLLIERIPDIVTADRDTLDFGDNQSLNTLSFNIVNSGYENLDWEIEERCDWITEIKPSKGTLAYGKTEGIVVVIDRGELNDGENKAVIVIRSSRGSSQMNVTAVGFTDMIKPDRETLDFGDNQSLNTLSFNIVNSGNKDMEWEIEERCDWITEINPSMGTLAHGRTEGIIVNIDRNKLNAGENRSVIIIHSAKGTSQMDVIAVGEERSTYVVNTLPVTSVQYTTATFNGEIVEWGTPAYTERGFVYSLMSNPTLDNAVGKVVAPINKDNQFSGTVKDLEHSRTYFVRAYVVNKAGTAYSSNEIKFNTAVPMPKVTTLDVTNIDLSSGTATFRGEITFVGEPPYTERGFVYGTTSQPTIYDNKVVSDGIGVVGTYSKYVTDLPKSTYYVRSYATCIHGTVYGEEKVVSTEWIEIPSVGIAVQTKDLGRVDWYTANSMCENSTIGGYNDWRLPTKDELMILYNNRQNIGGFNEDRYWSSSKSSAGYYYYISFSDGTIGGYRSDQKLYVRAVRTLTK